MGCGSSASADNAVSTNNNPPEPEEKKKEASSQPKTALDQFREEALAAHNQRRSLHGAPPLKLSAELNTIAQNYAEYLAKSGKFEHSTKETNKGAGENLAAHSNVVSGDFITDMWYDEIKDYDWDSPGFDMNTGHFTQVVWKETTHLGMGMSKEIDGTGMYVYVGNYLPAGNNVMPGKFQENVLPLQ